MRIFLLLIVLFNFVACASPATKPEDKVKTLLDGFIRVEPKAYEELTGRAPDAATLEGVKGLMGSLEYTIGAVNVDGNQATVAVLMGMRGADASDKKNMSIGLEKIGNEWKLTTAGKAAFIDAMGN
jgi:hypothetical protein